MATAVVVVLIAAVLMLAVSKGREKNKADMQAVEVVGWVGLWPSWARGVAVVVAVDKG